MIQYKEIDRIACKMNTLDMKSLTHRNFMKIIQIIMTIRYPL